MASPTMDKLKGGKGAAKGKSKGKGKTASAKLKPAEDETKFTKVPNFGKMNKKTIDAWYETESEFEIEEFGELTLDEKKAELYGVYNDVVLGVKDCYEEHVPAKAAPKDKPEVKGAKGKGKSATKGKGKKPGKALAKTDKSVSGEVLPPDRISIAAEELEGVKGEKEAHTILNVLVESDAMNYFKMGGILSVIQDNGWFGEHSNFRKYVENEVHGMEYRKATYLTKLYMDIMNSGCTWDEVSSIGWSSLRVIAPILTPGNVKAWVKKAEKNTTLQLIQLVKESQKKDQGKVEVSGARVSTKTFKCHEDQKETINLALGLAMEQGGTDVETVALEYICTQYVATGGVMNAPSKKKGGKDTAPVGMSLVQHFKKILKANDGDIDGAVDDVMGAFEKVFPKVDVMVNSEEEEPEK